MIKRIGKLKQQKGAVLFVVIAVMTLLIAMASTAYYTARSAHNTVISNYNYSQLYLSAVSVADMISEAVVNDVATNATSTNNYTPIKEAVADLNTPGSSIMAHTPNITTATASSESIIQQIASSGTSVIDGSLDGITIKIELPSNGVKYRYYVDGTDTAGNPVRYHYYDYTYVFTTTAFYNSNTVSVEDYLTTVKVKQSTGAPGTPGAPGSPGTPGTPGDPGNSNVNFTTFFTATGQSFGADGGYDKSSRVVKINADEITDDAFFENEYTFFNDGRPNRFKGGITASGSVYLNKFECTGIAGTTDNDWYIGKDLVLGNNNANKLDLGSDNDLFVGRDLVLACNANITADDVYVEGDIYIMGQAKIDGNLHVTGNIYYVMPEGTIGQENDQRTDPISVAADKNNGQYITRSDTSVINNGWTVTGALDVNSKIILPDGYSSAKVHVNGTTNTLTGGSDASNTGNNIGKYNPSNISVTVANRVADYDNDKFTTSSAQMSVSDAIALKTGTNNTYANYTSSQDAYDTEVVIDFSQLQPVIDAAGTTVGYEYSFDVTDASGNTYPVTISKGPGQGDDVTVNIPYIEKGIFLNIISDNIFGNGSPVDSNADVIYEIEGGPNADSPAMPVVLAPNIDAPTDSETDPNPGFSWRGDAYNNGSGWTDVSITGNGSVVFELANFVVGDDGKPILNNGDYVYTPYNPNSFKTTGSVTYVAGQKEVVGTADQVSYINHTESSNVSGMMDEGSVPKDEYQNRIMLVSNSRGRAVDANRQNNTFCGYIYAPNGEYYVSENTNSNMTPVFGGMIVSTYNASKAVFTYAEPKPSLIKTMLGSLVGYQIGSSGATPGTPGIPPTPGTPGTPATPPDDSNVTWAGTEGKWGREWQYEGSNYLG